MAYNSEVFLSELTENQAEELIEEDAYYQSLATPLKSAALIKKEHKKQLVDFFEFKEQADRFKHAQKLITDLMPTFVSHLAFTKIRDELNDTVLHFSHFMKEKAENAADQTILLQEMLGLSDETLIHIYALGRDLFQKGQFEDALALFSFLTTIAPHVSNYWILEGACFQNSNLHEEALAAFNTAKFLNPHNPIPIAYAIESYHQLNDKGQIKHEIELLEKVVMALSSIEIGVWRERLNQFKMKLN